MGRRRMSRGGCGIGPVAAQFPTAGDPRSCDGGRSSCSMRRRGHRSPARPGRAAASGQLNSDPAHVGIRHRSPTC